MIIAKCTALNAKVAILKKPSMFSFLKSLHCIQNLNRLRMVDLMQLSALMMDDIFKATFR